jgi:hypothetical protein
MIVGMDGTTYEQYFCYMPDTDKWRLRVVGNQNVEVSASAFSAGDWIQAVVTYDYDLDKYKIYINGELVLTSTLALTSSNVNEFNLGSRYNGTLQGGYTFAEFAVFDTVVSAAEVAAIYALQRPLVDAGAMDSPGIYILDGKFRLASSLSGNRIEINAEEIAGYNNTDVKQFYWRARDGAGMCGGGGIRLDSNGIQTVGSGTAGTNRQLRFIDNSGTEKDLGEVYASWGGGAGNAITWLISRHASGDPWPANNQVHIVAMDTVAGTDVRVEVHSSGNYYLNDGNVYMNGGNVQISSGDVVIGATVASNRLTVHDNVSGYTAHIFNDGNNANRYGLNIQSGEDNASVSGTAYPISFHDGDGTSCGGIVIQAGTAAFWESSDARLKKNIRPTTREGLKEIMALLVKDFEWPGCAGLVKTGFVAQDVEKVMPEAVCEMEGYKGLSVARFIPMIVKAIQELAEEVDTLTN